MARSSATQIRMHRDRPVGRISRRRNPRSIRGRSATRCHSSVQKARDEIAGFLAQAAMETPARPWSANGAAGGRGWGGRLGRPCRSRRQDAQLMRSGCGGQRRRLLPDVSGSQHAYLHRRYRQPLRFIARQLCCKTGSGTRNRECGNGCDRQGRLLHFNSPDERIRGGSLHLFAALRYHNIALQQCSALPSINSERPTS